MIIDAVKSDQDRRKAKSPPAPDSSATSDGLSGDSPGPRSPAILVIAWVVWLFATSVAVLIETSSDSSFYLQISTAAIALFVAGILLAFLCAWPQPLHVALKSLRLGPWMAVGFGVTFGLSSLAWLLDVQGQSAVIDRTYLIPASLVAFSGIVTMVAFYRLTPRILKRGFDRFDSALRGKAPVSPSNMAVLLIWAIAITSRGSSFVTGGSAEAQLATTSSLAQVVAIGSSFGLLATLLAASSFAVDRSAKQLALLVLVLVSQLALGFYSSSKEAVWIQLFAVAFGYGTSRRIRLIPTLAVALVALLFVVPFQTAYRDAGEKSFGSAGSSGISFDPGSFAAEAVEADRVQTLHDTARRTSRVGDLALIMQRTPSQIDYLSPLELAAAPFLSVIPRSFWKDKPVLDQSRQMSLIYYQLPYELYSASAMTPYGDLWRHGGVIPLLAGMAVIGLLLRMVDSRRGNPARDPRILFLPMLLFASVVKAEASFIELLATATSVILSSVLASRLVTIFSGGSAESSED